MPNTACPEPIAARWPFSRTFCTADREHLAKPTRAKRAQMEFTNTSEISLEPAQSVFSYPSQVLRGACSTDESRQEGMQQERSTTWIFSTGVSGHAHIRGRGALLGTGIRSATVTGHFGHAPERCSSNVNILLCTHVDARRVRQKTPSSFQKRYISPLQCDGSGITLILQRIALHYPGSCRRRKEV